jgi:hypothetical protein
MSTISSTKGTILIDIILAFSLSIIFVAIIAESSMSSRQIFESAKAADELLNIYDSNNGNVATKLRGNEEVEEDTSVSTSTQASSTRDSISNIEFIKVTSALPDSKLAEAIGTPLCSVDYSSNETIGSFEYFQQLANYSQSTSTSNAIQSNLITQIASSTVITPITLPIDPLLPLTDIEVRNGIAYISTDSAISADPDLLVADIHDPNHPTILSKINTGPGLASIALSGKRIFSAAPSTAAELHVIRLDGLSSPILEKKFKLPLPYATATPAVGSAIFFNDNKIYLGTEKWDGDEFNIIDVSNPASPTKIGGFEIGSKVNDIYVRDDLAFVAASSQDQLSVIDVKDPPKPILKSTFSPSGWARQEGKAISYFENGLNLSRTSGGYDYVNDHEAFAWQASSSASYSASLNYPSSDPGLLSFASVNIPGGVYGIERDRSRIYLATRQIDKEFQIFDQNFSTSTLVTFSLPVAPQTMTCDGDSIYVLAHTAPIIYKIRFK